MTTRRADVVGSAPGRVNLIGEHTDYNGGFALPLAIRQRASVNLRARADDVVVAASTAPDMAPVEFTTHTAPGDITGWAVHVAGVFWALRQAGHVVPGVDLRIESDVPVGAGLSSSHAVECAVIVALDHLAGLGLEPTTVALLAQQAENGYVGAPTGLMDQMAAMHGQDGHVILFDATGLTAEPVPCNLTAAGLALLVIDTQAPHRHADGEYGVRRRTCEDAARRLGVAALREVQDRPVDDVLAMLGDDVSRRRVRHVLTENARVLETVSRLRARQIREIGPLLTASHASLREDYEVTVPELDVATEVAVSAGALGARMTGGGFGGSVIALVEAGRLEAVADAVQRAFHDRGFTAPQTFVAVPSSGATVTVT